MNAEIGAEARKAPSANLAQVIETICGGLSGGVCGSCGSHAAKCLKRLCGSRGGIAEAEPPIPPKGNGGEGTRVPPSSSGIEIHERVPSLIVSTTNRKGTVMPFTARIETRDFARPFAEWSRRADERMRRAALVATDKASRAMLSEIRGQMAGAGLGRLGNALAATSDLKRIGRVHETSGGGWSASGGVYIRSRSERTRGALQAYTRGAAIRPKAGRWLWIPTDNVPRLSMRERLAAFFARAEQQLQTVPMLETGRWQEKRGAPAHGVPKRRR